MMSSPGRLASLARPRTPPVDSTGLEDLEQALDFLRTTIGSPQQKHIGIQTPPPSSPNKHKEYSTEDSCVERPRKRIRFDTEATVYEREGLSGNVATPPTSKYEPPTQTRGALKSILKPFAQPQCSIFPAIDVAECAEEPDMAAQTEMLESVVKQLGRCELFARLDAYLTLGNCIRAFRDHPDPAAIKTKLPLLESFMKRDIQQAQLASDPRQPKLAAQAVKAIVSLFHEHPTLVNHASDQFLDWLATDCIASASSDSGLKAVVKNQLLLFTLKSFSSVTLHPNPARLTRLLECLQTIDVRISGHGIRKVRLMIVKALMETMPKPMRVRIRIWLPTTVNELTASTDETQARAVEVVQSAALTFGSQSEATRAMKDALEDSVHCTSSGSTTRLVSNLRDKLTAMATSKDPAQRGRAAQIWSSVILFMRSDSAELQQWHRLHEWIDIIKYYFNSLDPSRNLDAWRAWNRFLIAVSPSSNTKWSMASLLRQPMVGHMNRSFNSRGGSVVYEEALSSYYLLLYFAFRPSASTEQISFFWKETVADFARKLDLRANDNYLRFSQVLSYLLYTSKLKLWQVDVTKQERNSSRFSLDILPRISSSWIRQNMRAILEVLKPLTIIAILRQSSEDNDVGVRTAWQALASAISEATTKEVYATTESKTAATEMLNFLCKHSSEVSASRELVQRPQSVVQFARDLFDDMSSVRLDEKALHSERNWNTIAQLRSQISGSQEELVFFPWLEAYENAQTAPNATVLTPEKGHRETEIMNENSSPAGSEASFSASTTLKDVPPSTAAQLSVTLDVEMSTHDEPRDEVMEELAPTFQHALQVGSKSEPYSTDETLKVMDGVKAPPNTPLSHQVIQRDNVDASDPPSPIQQLRSRSRSISLIAVIPQPNFKDDTKSSVPSFSLDGAADDDHIFSPPESVDGLSELENDNTADTHVRSEGDIQEESPSSSEAQGGREPFLELDLNSSPILNEETRRPDASKTTSATKECIPLLDLEERTPASQKMKVSVVVPTTKSDHPTYNVEPLSGLPSIEKSNEALSTEPSTELSDESFNVEPPTANSPPNLANSRQRGHPSKTTRRPSTHIEAIKGEATTTDSSEPVCDLPDSDYIVVRQGPRTMTFAEACKRFKRSKHMGNGGSSTKVQSEEPGQSHKRKRNSVDADTHDSSSKRPRQVEAQKSAEEEQESASNHPPQTDEHSGSANRVATADGGGMVRRLRGVFAGYTNYFLG